jgi:hypothetical protein
MRVAPLAALGLVTLLVWSFLAGGDLSGAGVVRFELLYFAAAGAFALALALIAAGRAQAPERSPKHELTLIVVGAILFRLVLLGAEPDLSTDCFRYLWEGKVQVAGFNPYLHAPADPALASLRDAAWEHVNHPEIPAIYGPLMQILFALVALIGGGLLTLKAVFVTADVALGGLILRGLLRRGHSPLWLVVYAWHPLPILEVVGQAHLELVPILLTVLAIELEHSGRARLAALALGLAIAAKYLPLLLVPAFLMNRSSGRERLERLALIALPSALLVIPYLGAGLHLTDGLSAYGSAWRFNDGGFLALDATLSAVGLSQAFCRNVLPFFVDVSPGFDPAGHTTWMLILPKAVVGVVVLAVTALLARPTKGTVDLDRAALGAGCLFLVFSPTVHPWYGLWVLPFLPAAARTLRNAAWLTLTLTLPLAYVATGNGWIEEPWVRVVEYGPPLALLLAAGIPRRPEGTLG